MRTACAVLTALIALAVTQAAQAATPTPTISTGYGSATLREQGGTLTRPGEPTMRKVIDWSGPDTSTLIAAPGGTVTITIDTAVEAAVARLDGGAGPLLPLVQTGERSYVATLPADVVLPRWFFLELAFPLGEDRLTSEWSKNLVGLPAPAPPPPPVIAEPPEQPATIGSARLSGRRLTVSVICPAGGRDCTGMLTLKTSSLRVARLTFTGIRPGSSETLRATVRGAAVRHLKRHGIKRLRTVMTPTGGAPAVTHVRLKGV